MDTLINVAVQYKVHILTGLAVLATAKIVKAVTKKEPVYEKDVVYLYDFPNHDIPNIRHVSPFVLKVAAFLNYTGIKHEVVHSMENGPRSKKPFIRYNGQLITDSQEIIEFLIKEFKIDSLELKNKEQIAEAHILRRYIEDSLIWTLVYSRWTDPEFAPTTVPRMLSSVPAPMRRIVCRIASKRITESLNHNGLGRVPKEKIYARGIEDIRALATRLGDKPYLIGDKISLVDISMYSMLVQYYRPIDPTPLSNEINKHQNLIKYIESLESKLFPNK